MLGDDHERFWSLSFGVRRPTWELLGGFDDGFVGYGAEDTDLGLRAAELGIPLAWFGGGTAFHQWHPPTRHRPRPPRRDDRQRPPLPAAGGVVADGGLVTQLAERRPVQFDPTATSCAGER